MSETIDKLIFALDGDLSALKGKFAEADVAAQKTGASMRNSLGLKEAADQAVKSASAVSRALGETEKAVKSVHGSTAVATREFRALFDELSSGRTRQTPGTLAIIATRVFGISGATLAWGVALAAIPAALVYAAVQSENTFSRIQRQLAATGYAAGVSRDQILSLGQALDQTSRVSQRGAMDIATALASRGSVGLAQLPSATRAAYGLAVGTGTKEDKAALDLEKMLANPTKGAEELSQQFNLLTVAQQEEIKTLQASGDSAKAQQIIIDSLNDRFGELEGSSWSLARTFDGVGKFLSDFWAHTGQFLSGTGQTKQQQLNDLQGMQAFIESTLRQHGISGIGGARALVARDPQNAGLGVGDAALGNLIKQFDQDATKIAALQHDAAVDAAKTKGGQFFKQQQDAVGQGLKLSRQYDDQAEKVRKLTAEHEALTKAVGLAIGPDVQFQDELKKRAEAVKTALDNVRQYGDPVAEAQRRAADQARINAARPEDRARISAEVEAGRTLRESLQDPNRAMNAQAIFKVQMQTADQPDRYNRTEDVRKKNLKAMQEEARSAFDLAQAYAKGSSAAEAAKITDEARLAVIRKEIDNEKEYAKALQNRAYWSAIAAAEQRNQKLIETNAGLDAAIAAGGDPVAVAAAKRQARALQDNAAAFSTAHTMQEHMRVYGLYQQELGGLGTEDLKNSIISAQSSSYSGKRALGNIRAQLSATQGGATPDDLRDLKAAQEVFDALVKTGLDPTTQKFKELYAEMVPVAQQTGDLADQLEKLHQAASDFASGISGPIGQELSHGGSLKHMVGGIEQNEVDAAVKDFITQPLQDQLQGMFGNLLGAPGGKADGTMTSPFWVRLWGQGAGGGAGGSDPMSQLMNSVFGGGSSSGDASNPYMNTDFPDLASPGASSSGGGIFGMLGSLFGGGGGADAAAMADIPDMGAGIGGAMDAASSSGGIMDLLTTFMGFFDDGGTIGAGQWGIKSGIPEIIQGGTSGVSVAPLTAPAIRQAIGAPNYAGGDELAQMLGASSSMGAKQEINFHFPPGTDVQSFVRSRSQLEAVVTRMGAKGRRNT